MRKAQTLTDEVSVLNSNVSNLDSEVSSLKVHSSHLGTEIETLGDELTVVQNEKRDQHVANTAAICKMAGYGQSYVSGSMPGKLLFDDLQNKFGVCLFPKEMHTH